MPYAITLRLDAAAATRVAALWRTLAERGISDDSIRLGYGPHVTLAILPDAADHEQLVSVAAGLVPCLRPIHVVFSHLGLFPGACSVLFLAPAASATLLERHAEVLAALAGAPVDPHYRAGQWVPHVTLAKDVVNPAAAILALGGAGLPIPAILDTLEVVRFRPVERLDSFPLG